MNNKKEKTLHIYKIVLPSTFRISTIYLLIIHINLTKSKSFTFYNKKWNFFHVLYLLLWSGRYAGMRRQHKNKSIFYNLWIKEKKIVSISLSLQNVFELTFIYMCLALVLFYYLKMTLENVVMKLFAIAIEVFKLFFLISFFYFVYQTLHFGSW